MVKTDIVLRRRRGMMSDFLQRQCMVHLACGHKDETDRELIGGFRPRYFR